MNQYYFGTVQLVTIILLSLWKNAVRPLGLTVFKANVILQNTFALQMTSDEVQAVRPVPILEHVTYCQDHFIMGPGHLNNECIL